MHTSLARNWSTRLLSVLSYSFTERTSLLHSTSGYSDFVYLSRDGEVCVSIFTCRWCIQESWKNIFGVLESPGKVLEFFLTKRVGTLYWFFICFSFKSVLMLCDRQSCLLSTLLVVGMCINWLHIWSYIFVQSQVLWEHLIDTKHKYTFLVEMEVALLLQLYSLFPAQTVMMPHNCLPLLLKTPRWRHDVFRCHIIVWLYCWRLRGGGTMFSGVLSWLRHAF